MGLADLPISPPGLAHPPLIGQIMPVPMRRGDPFWRPSRVDSSRRLPVSPSGTTTGHGLGLRRLLGGGRLNGRLQPRAAGRHGAGGGGEPEDPGRPFGLEVRPKRRADWTRGLTTHSGRPKRKE